MEHLLKIFFFLRAGGYKRRKRARLVGYFCFPTIITQVFAIFPTCIVPRGTMKKADKYRLLAPKRRAIPPLLHVMMFKA